MIELDENHFRRLVTEAIDSLPEQFEHADNVAIVVEDFPTMEQSKKLRLCRGQLLFGLYEGIPLTKRGANYNLVLPDKITVFKKSIELVSSTIEEVAIRVRDTVWHELAHHYGFDHKGIDQMLDKRKKAT